ncbi:HalOD1 output domain-containing protein [Natronosalvus vescus]|uniref:HalOD1 output domain-containing protein n=1 Tax=Natronosalvus vescus TaxID=2953881 RepID=UPI0020902C21|nr:HalOD1 output domain-containing protein [Natronosalvus vescus]
MVQAQTATAHVDNVSNEVVKMVAEVEDVNPLELTPPLYEVIDPDALDQIFASMPSAGRMEGQVTFSYNGYKVTVCGDGYVSVQ